MPTPTTEKRWIQATELRVAKGEGGKPSRLIGYAATFNSLSNVLGSGRAQFREKIKPGAFADAIAAGQDVRAAFNHDPNHVLARTKNGTLRLSEDDKGLRFEADLNPDDPAAMSVAAKVERGDVDGCSFAFRTLKDSWAQDNGENVRTLEKCDVIDVGPVTYPAYDATSVDVRSAAHAIARLPRRAGGAGAPAGGAAGAAGAEARATIEVEDDSLVWVCRCAIDYLRYAFDACQNVMDVAGRVTGELNGRDQEAIDDCVDNLVDLVAKARKTRAILDALGADDEDPADPAAAEGKPSAETAAVNPMDEDDEDADRSAGRAAGQAAKADPLGAARRRLQLAEAL
jgi:hypothetical protein